MLEFTTRDIMFLLTVLLVTLTSIKFLLTEDIGCPVVNPGNKHCHCAFREFGHIIKCWNSTGNSQIGLQVVHMDFDIAEIMIICHDNDVNSYNLLPVMDIENYKW